MNVKIEINVKSINTPTGIKGAEICKSIHCEVLAICENKVYKMHSKSWKTLMKLEMMMNLLRSWQV